MGAEFFLGVKAAGVLLKQAIAKILLYVLNAGTNFFRKEMGTQTQPMAHCVIIFYSLYHFLFVLGTRAPSWIGFPH
jgi:hypothetical protein